MMPDFLIMFLRGLSSKQIEELEQYLDEYDPEDIINDIEDELVEMEMEDY